jgi:hypothetical protein
MKDPSRIHVEDSIKRPMNIVKPEPVMAILKPLNQVSRREEPKYQMMTDTSMQRTSDQDNMSVPNNYNMNDDFSGKIPFNRIFPESKGPSILDQKKRHRRLSSIVGIKSNPYGREFDIMEDVLEPKMTEYNRPNSRSTSIDCNGQSDYYIDSPY